MLLMYGRARGAIVACYALLSTSFNRSCASCFPPEPRGDALPIDCAPNHRKRCNTLPATTSRHPLRPHGPRKSRKQSRDQSRSQGYPQGLRRRPALCCPRRLLWPPPALQREVPHGQPVTCCAASWLREIRAALCVDPGSATQAPPSRAALEKPRYTIIYHV